MAALIVTFSQAVEHLRAQGIEDTSDLHLKLQQANDVAVVLLKRGEESPVWSDDTDPEIDTEFSIAQALVLRLLGHLYRFRGDDDTTCDPIVDNEHVIRMLRDPSIA